MGPDVAGNQENEHNAKSQYLQQDLGCGWMATRKGYIWRTAKGFGTSPGMRPQPGAAHWGRALCSGRCRSISARYWAVTISGVAVRFSNLRAAVP
jgi:hypothetical protein